MRKYAALSILFFLLFLTPIFAVHARAGAKTTPAAKPPTKTEEYLVRFHKEVSKEKRSEIFARHGIQEKKEVKVSFGTFYVVEVPAGFSRKEWEAKMKKEPEVNYIEPNATYHIQDKGQKAGPGVQSPNAEI
jgi:hypothetical protein